MTRNDAKGKSSRYRASAITAVIVALAVILYAVGGLWVVPPILKVKLESAVSDAFGVSATLTDVAINPFALSVTLGGCEVKAGEKTLARFEELYVDFDLSSLFHRAYTFSAIRIVGPEGLVEVLPDGSLNWSVLAPAEGGQSAEMPSGDTPPEGQIAPVLVHRLQIDRGRFTFSDLSQSEPFDAQLFPIQISLDGFSTRKDDDGVFQFVANLGRGGEVEWKGDLSINPLRSQGTVELRGVILRTLWEYVRDRVNFEITKGSMDVGLRYVFEAGPGTDRFDLKDGSLTITDVALCEKGVPETLISVPLMACRNVGLNLEKKVLSIGSVTSAHAAIAGWRDSDGSLSLQTVFAPPPGKRGECPNPRAEGVIEEKGEAWRIDIGDLSLEDYGIAFEDRMYATPVYTSLDPIDLHIKDVTSRAGSQSSIDLGLTVNRTGTMEIKGSVCLDPMMLDCSVSLSKIALKHFQPYLDPFVKSTIVEGTVGLGGTVRYNNAGEKTPALLYRGMFRVDGFDAEDRTHNEDLLKWESLVLSGMEIDLSPDRLHVADIALTKPYAKIVIFPDRTVNLTAVFAQEDNAERAETVSSPSSAVEEVDDGKKAFATTIDTVRISDGSLNFADFSLTPNFAVGIQDLNGEIKGLSSDPSARADVSLTGAVDRYAPVRITGKINPLSPARFIDVALSFKNMELTTLTPYSGKFAGYAIRKGKMSLDLDYTLQGSKLIGENKLFLNQLTLGERVESPSATKLPVTLAVGLLKDRQGNINIDLPVKGDIDDPEFSYGQLVFKAFMNLITKVVTSPFALLGSLFGGGEDLSHIDFAYGSAEVTPEQMKKLDMLARSLNERPALRLEIRGTADRTSDRAALAEKELIRTLRKLKADELRGAGKKVPPAVDDIILSDAEYQRLLKKAYETTQKDKGADKGKPVDTDRAMERFLIDAATVADVDLRQLAKERAQRIKGHLIQKGKIENERIFILDVQVRDTAQDDTARIVLSLS